MFPIISNVLKNGLVHQPRLSFMNCCTSSLLLNILNLPLMFGQLLNSPMKVSMLSPIMFITVSKSNYCVSGPSTLLIPFWDSRLWGQDIESVTQLNISTPGYSQSGRRRHAFPPPYSKYYLYSLHCIWSQWAQSTGKINAAQLNQIHDYHPVKP